MNYLREINEFQGWAMRNRLSTGEIALWYALMSANNEVGWSDEFAASSLLLQLMTGLSRQGIERARSQLIAKMRVEYRKGTGKSAGVYSMKSFECQKVGTRVGTTVAENEVPSGHNSGVSVGTKIFPSMSDLSTKQNKTKTKDDAATVRAEEVSEIELDTSYSRAESNEIDLLAAKLTRHTPLHGDELNMIRDLAAMGVRASIVTRVIQETIDTYTPKYAGDQVKKLTYCRGRILELHALETGEFTNRQMEGREYGGGQHSSQRAASAYQAVAKPEANAFTGLDTYTWEPPPGVG